ncbi:MAG: hypothetical protein HOO06_13315 [Bdellovibrionaceae bacterium]|jgi:hypothetical protein|nr:hypothetical protein [Pseudobdellovibrionaceae bacterium]
MDKKVTTKSKPLPQIDLKALEYNLSLSVDKRLLQHQSAFETVSELKKAHKRLYEKPQPITSDFTQG